MSRAADGQPYDGLVEPHSRPPERLFWALFGAWNTEEQSACNPLPRVNPKVS